MRHINIMRLLDLMGWEWHGITSAVVLPKIHNHDHLKLRDILQNNSVLFKNVKVMTKKEGGIILFWDS